MLDTCFSLDLYVPSNSRLSLDCVPTCVYGDYVGGEYLPCISPITPVPWCPPLDIVYHAFEQPDLPPFLCSSSRSSALICDLMGDGFALLQVCTLTSMSGWAAFRASFGHGLARRHRG